MNTESDTKETLCFTCHYYKRIISGKGSFFVLCGMHYKNPKKYPKYPSLPVLTCAGYIDITGRNG